MNLRVDPERLQRQIDEMAAISEVPAPLLTRVLFSQADLRGRRLITDLCHATVLADRKEAVGNILAGGPGKAPDLAPMAPGSHMDAMPNAGRSDGVVGVLGASEAIRAVRRAGFEPRRALELTVFAAEEPTRF